jgi:hypothetical protein
MKVPTKDVLENCIMELDPAFPVSVIKKCNRSELLEIVKLKLKNKKIVNHIKQLDGMISEFEKQRKKNSNNNH